jgi:pimeloyl-ACP methyl ester carboxylesterase
MKSILYKLSYHFYSSKRYKVLKKNLLLKEKKINNGGLPFTYFESTNEGKNLVLLHGLLDASFGFRKMIPFLKNWKIIVPDVPGFGKNSLPPISILWNLDVIAKLIYDAIKALNLREITLVGHSMGGLLSQHICLLDQKGEKRIERLVLLSTGNEPSPRRDELKDILFPKNRDEVVRLLHQLYHKNFPDPNYFIQDMLVYIWNSNEYELLAKNTIEREAEIFFGKRAKEIKIPVHLVVGDEDSITDIHSIKKLHSWIKGSTIDIIREAKHALHLEYPEQIANIINQYGGH